MKRRQRYVLARSNQHREEISCTVWENLKMYSRHILTEILMKKLKTEKNMIEVKKKALYSYILIPLDYVVQIDNMELGTDQPDKKKRISIQAERVITCLLFFLIWGLKAGHLALRQVLRER